MKRLAVVILACCSGCVAWAPAAPGQVSPDAVVLAVPAYEQQGQYDCGHATLSMLFAYYAHKPDAARSQALSAKAESEFGTTGADLCSYLESEEFDALLFSGEISNELTGLFYHLDRGRPLIACLGNDATDKTSRHFVLVVGYDPHSELIFVQDPVRGGVRIAYWQFDVFWKRCDRFCLLAVPKTLGSK